MKIVNITLVIFFILVAFACNNQQSKKADDKTVEVIKPQSEKPGIKKTDNPEYTKFKSCENVVTDIVTTSPRFVRLTKGLYKAVVRNGGQSFGMNLEGSPNPLPENGCRYSKTYDYTLYETYPDRQLNTARFSFNPKKRRLYEYDAVYDELIEIAFDRALLLKYEALCK